MLSGSWVRVDVTSFQNDAVSFVSKDDVLTYLIHLGYLGYDQNTEMAFIPNEEIRQELIRATYFKPIRELPTGGGFADFVFLPKPEYRSEYPALVVELKWNKSAHTAMSQIKEKKYTASIETYTGTILLVAVNYDKNSKEHQCQIERYEKNRGRTGVGSIVP